MSTSTVEIWCINVLLDSPNGNVQLVFNEFLKANHNYALLEKAMETGELITCADSYGEKCAIRGSNINTVVFNDVIASKGGASALSLIHDLANIAYQTKLSQRSEVQAAQRVAQLNGAFRGMGPANG